MSTLDQVLAEMDAPTVWPDVLPGHLSASQLTMLARCPEQYRRRYLLGLKERPGAALMWGAADHYAHEQNFRQKIASHTDLPVGDVKEAFAEGFDQAVGRAGEIDWGNDTPGDMKDRGVVLAAHYHETVSPTVQPTAVEHSFQLRIPGVPVPVIGYLDVLEDGRAIERKTVKAKAVTVKPRWRVQGMLYQLVERTPVHWHVSTKTKLPAVYTPATEPGLALDAVAVANETTVRMVQTRVAQLLSLLDRFGPDNPWPDALTDDWACAYCGWGPAGNQTCAWWQR